MKKLMIMSAVAALAIGAQAAITYQMMNGYKGGELSDDTIGYYSLYARAATDTQFGSSAAEIENYFSTQIAEGNWAGAKAAWSDTTATPMPTKAAHNFPIKDIVNESLTFDRKDSGQNYNYFAVIFYKNGEAEGYRVVQGDKPTATSTENTFVTQGTNGTWGNWKTAPEPTSGLLLLLGVAGLALKRKRA